MKARSGTLLWGEGIVRPLVIWSQRGWLLSVWKHGDKLASVIFVVWASREFSYSSMCLWTPSQYGLECVFHGMYLHDVFANMHLYGIQSYENMYIHTYIHTCMHACIHPYIQTYIHTYIHVHTCAYMCIHTYIHTYRHTDTWQSHPEFFTVKTFQRMQSRKLPERMIEAHSVKVWWCWMCDGHVILNPLPLHHAFHLCAWTISFLFRWFPGSWQNAGRTNCGHVSSIATPREDLGTTNLSRCNCRFVSA